MILKGAVLDPNSDLKSLGLKDNVKKRKQ